MSTAPSPGFSREFDFARLTAAETVAVSASPDECAALAAAFDLPAIAALSGRVLMCRLPNGRVAAQLDLDARVTRICVVTLDLFEQRVSERSALIFVPARGREDAEEGDMIDDLDSPDEIVADGTVVDLGALIAEQLALALDPWPRKPDAVLPDPGEARAEGPFAALAALKRGGEPEGG
ncbi:MAG TPA: DUF177 domain-containing protein [Acidiphilium sp.]